MGMTIQMDIKTAPSLRELVDRVTAGDEIVIESDGKPIVRLSRAVGSDRKSIFGTFKGKVVMSDDFDAPLSVADLKEWGL